MSAPKGRRTGRCTICSSEHRYRIEVLLVGGAGRRAIARRFNVSPDAVWRHSKAHISAEQRAQILGGPVKLRELADKAAEEGLGLLEYISMLRSSALTQYFSAAEAGDKQTVTALLGRLTDLLRLQGQFSGELTRATQNITTNVAVFSSPIVADIEQVLLDRLRPYPDAMKAVLEGLEALREQRLSGSALPAPSKVLEHVA